MTTEQQHQPTWTHENDPRSAPPPPPIIAVRPDLTLPLPPLPEAGPEPTIFGFPAEFATGADAERLIDTSAVAVSDDGGHPGGPAGPARPTAVHLTTLRRADPIAGLALVSAGVAAAVSLLLPWYRGLDASALPAVRQGVVLLRSGVGALGRSGLWSPLVVVLGGGVLLLLGFLLFRRARTHRLVGVLAMLVAMAAGAGVVVPLANANWTTASFGPGLWSAVAVAGLGTVGALKAMLTVPVVRVG